MTVNKEITDHQALAGAGAPPMVNGELVFEAPWQGRVFGMARVLCEAGVFSWDEFRALLISNIAVWEQQHQQGAFHRENSPSDNSPSDNSPSENSRYDSNPFESSYYEIFLQSLHMLLGSKGLCSADELKAREAALFARPHGHDH